MIPSRCRPNPDDFILYVGASIRVEWYYAPNGRMPAREHFLALPQLDQERLLKLVEYLANAPLGTRLARSVYRIEDAANKIFAFKPRDERYFNFMTDGRRIIITNAYRKHSQKMGKVDVEKMKTAIAYRLDYLQRVGNGTYDESET